MNRPCEHLKNFTEAMSVAEINRLLYLPGHRPDLTTRGPTSTINQQGTRL